MPLFPHFFTSLLHKTENHLQKSEIQFSQKMKVDATKIKSNFTKIAGKSNFNNIKPFKFHFRIMYMFT